MMLVLRIPNSVFAAKRNWVVPMHSPFLPVAGAMVDLRAQLKRHRLKTRWTVAAHPQEMNANIVPLGNEEDWGAALIPGKRASL